MTRVGWAVWISLLAVFVGYAVVSVGQSLENARPVAAFRVSIGSSSIPTAVFLDGTASSDPDGSIVTYQWLFGDGTTGSGAQTEHVYPQVDEYQVTLVVIDNLGASHMVTKTVDLGRLDQQDEAPEASSGSRAFSRSPVTPSSAPEGYEVGDRAPDFTLPTLDGESVQLSKYLGQVVVVEFWFITCSGCVASLPHLEDLRAQFEEDGLAILLVVLDRDPTDAKAFFVENGYTRFVLAHEHDWSRPTRTAYDVGGTPHTFLIDRSGAIRFSGKPSQLTSDLIASWL